MNSAESFSFDYQTARTKFLAAARDAGAALEATLHPERGPDGGDLTPTCGRGVARLHAVQTVEDTKEIVPRVQPAAAGDRIRPQPDDCADPRT